MGSGFTNYSKSSMEFNTVIDFIRLLSSAAIDNPTGVPISWNEMHLMNIQGIQEMVAKGSKAAEGIVEILGPVR
jgi:hypothetical protein